MEVFCLRDLQEESGDLQEGTAADTAGSDTARRHPVGTPSSAQKRPCSPLIGAAGTSWEPGSVGCCSWRPTLEVRCVPSWGASAPAWALVGCWEQRGYARNYSTHTSLWGRLLPGEESL